MTIATPIDIKRLITGYQLCSSTEGKSYYSVGIVITSLKCFQRFLSIHQNGINLTDVTRQRNRGFISYPLQTLCYVSQPFVRKKEKMFSGHSVNYYLLSLWIFYS